MLDREPIGFFARGDEIAPARINIDAAWLSFGGKVRGVSELASARRHCEQRDLVGVALGRIEKFSVWRQPQIGGPDRRLLVGLE